MHLLFLRFSVILILLSPSEKIRSSGNIISRPIELDSPRAKSLAVGSAITTVDDSDDSGIVLCDTTSFPGLILSPIWDDPLPPKSSIWSECPYVIKYNKRLKLSI